MMLKRKTPEAFDKVADAFNQSFTYLFEGDEITKIRGHLEFVPKQVRVEARVYLTKLLASSVTDDDLQAIWRASSSQIYIERGIRYFFEALRDNL